MSTSRRILLTTSLALATAGLAAAMALVVLPAGAVDLGQAPHVVGLLDEPGNGRTNGPVPLDINVGQLVTPGPGPIGCPVPLDINCGRLPLT
jgi:hypothetical protein